MLSPPAPRRLTWWIEDNLHPFGWLTLAFVGCATYLAALAWAWQNTSYDVWGAILIAPLLILITMPLARFAAYQEHDPTMARLIISALVVKLVMTVVRYVVAFGVYGGAADAKGYHDVGTQLARLFRSGDLSTAGEEITGTGFIRILTGAIYTVTGPTMIGGFLLFSFMGFWGLYFFYRAFRIAVPDGNHRWYARLVFFLPSMLFWPSSVGKEAWMCLMLGIAALGAAKTLAHQRGAFPVLAVGLVGCSFVRPHVGLLFFIGMSTAFLLRQGRRGVLGPFPKVIGTIALAVAGVFLLAQVETFFGVDSLGEGGAGDALDIAQERTEQGGSAFQAVPPTSPGRFAWGALTVLFRPFPQEAGNVQGLLASLEAMMVFALCGHALPRAWRIVLHLRQWGFAVLALTYTLAFCYAFASIGNFGILTRQRVQVLPFLLVLICLPDTRPARTRDIPSVERAAPVAV